MRRNIKRIIRTRLLRYGSPRFQMFLMLTFTGFAGFTTSAFLAKLGLHAMWIRYPISVFMAYLVFFASLSLWIQLILSREDYSSNVTQEIRDAVEQKLNEPMDVHSVNTGTSGSEGTSWDPGIPDIGLDIDGLFVMIVLVAILVLLAGASVYLVWTAPAFLGEVLINALALSGFHSRLRKIQAEHWSLGAFKRTWLIFLVTAAFFSLLGCIIQGDDPSIITIGDFLKNGS